MSPKSSSDSKLKINRLNLLSGNSKRINHSASGMVSTAFTQISVKEIKENGTEDMRRLFGEGRS